MSLYGMLTFIWVSVGRVTSEIWLSGSCGHGYVSRFEYRFEVIKDVLPLLKHEGLLVVEVGTMVLLHGFSLLLGDETGQMHHL